MQNVVAFPKKAVAQPLTETTRSAKTLFVHIRQTTLIMHLAAHTTEVTSGSRIGTQV